MLMTAGRTVTAPGLVSWPAISEESLMSLVEDAAAEASTLLREVQLGNTTVTLLGTAHISRSSAEQVAAELDSKAYQAVAVELCPSRFEALTNPDRLAQL